MMHFQLRIFIFNYFPQRAGLKGSLSKDNTTAGYFSKYIYCTSPSPNTWPQGRIQHFYKGGSRGWGRGSGGMLEIWKCIGEKGIILLHGREVVSPPLTWIRHWALVYLINTEKTLCLLERRGMGN